ncbi:CvpA family protein [Clostridium cylindrosporum]|uniref:Colicin V production protein n=1 Tax=Clostridium cylindrosporum DSM 605 TaxID=1121307 RepID=A0A0J8DBU6_CLOCY|nr:CvpA family protein [Clostridium cylindrosporum]KMT21763.1 hypothetical protein CLCY_3c00300 [Clostridium cylindrosporum DSM 605]
MNYLDIIILVILVLGVISGARKGLVISILNIVGLVVTFILCFSFSGTLSKLLIKYTDIEVAINSLVSQRINSLDPFTVNIINKLKIAGMSPNEFLTSNFINAAIFIVLFICITIIIGMLKQGIKNGIKKSVLGPIDSVLGGVLGFIKWILILSVVFAFVTPIVPLLTKNNNFYVLIDGSILAKNLINYNLITTLIKSFFEGNIKNLIKM